MGGKAVVCMKLMQKKLNQAEKNDPILMAKRHEKIYEHKSGLVCQLSFDITRW